MNRTTMNPFLRKTLAADAIASGAIGVLLAALPAYLAGLLGLPEALLEYTGVFLLGYAAFVAWLATRSRPVTALVWLVIVGNAIWVIDSLLLLASGWVGPTWLGYAFVIAQALAVGVFAQLQFVGVRRAHPQGSATPSASPR